MLYKESSKWVDSLTSLIYKTENSMLYCRQQQSSWELRGSAVCGKRKASEAWVASLCHLRVDDCVVVRSEGLQNRPLKELRFLTNFLIGRNGAAYWAHNDSTSSRDDVTLQLLHINYSVLLHIVILYNQLLGGTGCMTWTIFSTLQYVPKVIELLGLR